ncbi:MAG: NnrS family protein [Methylacidiphilaceae bacterium]|nr:NnrS family protein [Candidatus Methylacidiphilaceae bacterium]
MAGENELPGTKPLPWMEWTRLSAGEPYRILFPLGLFLGALGVAVWPLFFFWGVAWAPPPISHPRILIEGFVGSFVLGFLGTSVPRLLEVKRLSPWETGAVTVAILAVGLLHFFGVAGWGDGLFGITLLFFLWRLAIRFPSRKDNPPPSFVLALFGVLGAGTGALVESTERMGLTLSPCLRQLGLLLLYQGLPLLPILGVGAFILPRFYGLPSRETLPEARIPTRAWIGRALAALAAASSLFASFAWEAAGASWRGGLLRAGTVVAYLLFAIPASRELFARGTVAGCARLSLLLSVLGLLLASLSLPLRAAWLHLFFLGGAGLLILTVGARVVLGFSGRGELLAGRYGPLSQAKWWILGAILLRVAADVEPARRDLLLSGASLFWLGALLLWSWAVLPKVRCPDAED